MGKMMASWLVAVLLIAVTPASAWAQDDDEDNATAGLITTTLVVSPLTTTSYLVQMLLESWTDKKLDEARLYMEHNATALARDVTLGAGPTIDDLAQAMGLPRRRHAAFGRGLRRERAAIVAMLAHPGEHAAAFVALLRRVSRSKDHP